MCPPAVLDAPPERGYIGRGGPYSDFRMSPPPHHLEEDKKKLKTRNENPPAGKRLGSAVRPRPERLLPHSLESNFHLSNLTYNHVKNYETEEVVYNILV
jgi:hypothetical protein